MTKEEALAMLRKMLPEDTGIVYAAVEIAKRETTAATPWVLYVWAPEGVMRVQNGRKGMRYAGGLISIALDRERRRDRKGIFMDSIAGDMRDLVGLLAITLYGRSSALLLVELG